MAACRFLINYVVICRCKLCRLVAKFQILYFKFILGDFFWLKLDFEKLIKLGNYSVLPLSIQEVLKNMDALYIF